MAIKNFVALLCLFPIHFLGCTPVRVVSSTIQPGTNIKSYKTYNYMDILMKNQASAELDSEGIQLLKAAIDKEMQDRGFSKSENPEMWMNIGIVIEDKVQTRQTNIRDAPLYIGQRNIPGEVKKWK